MLQCYVQTLNMMGFLTNETAQFLFLAVWDILVSPVGEIKISRAICQKSVKRVKCQFFAIRSLNYL